MEKKKEREPQMRGGGWGGGERRKKEGKKKKKVGKKGKKRIEKEECEKEEPQSIMRCGEETTSAKAKIVWYSRHNTIMQIGYPEKVKEEAITFYSDIRELMTSEKARFRLDNFGGAIFERPLDLGGCEGMLQCHG